MPKKKAARAKKKAKPKSRGHARAHSVRRARQYEEGQLFNASEWLWAAVVNLNGLYSDTPIALSYREPDTGVYWDKEGELDAVGPGRIIGPGRIQFTSTSKVEVEAWISGVRATMTMLKRWVAAG